MSNLLFFFLDFNSTSSSNQRPERLKSKIPGNDDLNQNKNSLMRQAKGPDGTKGFAPRTKENSIF